MILGHLRALWVSDDMCDAFFDGKILLVSLGYSIFSWFFSGLIGDRLARCCPLHGRPLTAQISVLPAA